jgi:ABC-2 type transport system permease protein
MRKVLAVAWREFKHTALTKAFIIGTIIFPLLIWGGMAAGGLLIGASETIVEGKLAIIDPTGRVVEAATIEFDPDRQRDIVQQIEDLAEAEPDEIAERATDLARESGAFGTVVHLQLSILGYDDPGRLDALQEQVRQGELIGVAVIDERVLQVEERGRGLVSLFVAQNANPDHTAAINRALGRSVVRARADMAGYGVEELRAMMRSPNVNTRRLTEVGEQAAGIELQRLLPIAFMILLWISAFASGNYLLTTTIEEKSNKVMEVLLSAISPMQLMTGKILGQAVVGFCTMAVYATLGIGALIIFGMAGLVDWAHILYLVVYFFMAYFMIAAMMAGIGSAVSDLQEAHALITPAMLVLFVPMILFMPVSQNPNGLLAVITSFIPIFTPFVMIIRVTASEPIPFWHIPLSFAVGAIGVVGSIWLCARIFRVGVLMYGKPPSPLELIKWLRYS